MVKRYYCDYCNKSFQDTRQNRRKHLKGISHLRNRKAHYDSIAAGFAINPQPKLPDTSLLYSMLSGEEMFQQWLAKHPEIVKRHIQMQTSSSTSHDTTGSDTELAKMNNSECDTCTSKEPCLKESS